MCPFLRLQYDCCRFIYLCFHHIFNCYRYIYGCFHFICDCFQLLYGCFRLSIIASTLNTVASALLMIASGFIMVASRSLWLLPYRGLCIKLSTYLFHCEPFSYRIMIICFFWRIILRSIPLFYYFFPLVTY